MIRYLQGNEKQITRGLWVQAFSEESSSSFDDYYFMDKMADNQVLVKEENGKIISMIHRNPYQVQMRDRLWNVDYVVGVATDRDRRKQGHMRDLLCQMLTDMEGEGMPFCFLMPAAEQIYRPFDFTFIYDQPIWKLRDDVDRSTLSVSVRKNMENLADWVNRWLESHWEVWCVRDRAYMERLCRELASENGEIYEIESVDGFAGIQGFWGLEKREQRFLYCDRIYLEKEQTLTPAIMGRIVHLNHFLQNICLDEECPEDDLDVMIQVEDHFLSDNHGIFRWHLTKRSSCVERSHGRFDVSLDIGQLTAWLFGYRSLEEILGDCRAIPEWCSMVRTIRSVFLDEVV